MKLVDRVLGEPARLDGPGLARGVRRGSELHAVACVRWLGERAEPEATALLGSLLDDPRASVRRAAAWALAWRDDPRAAPAFAALWDRDRSEETRLAVAVGLARAGDAAARARLLAWEERRLATIAGPRAPAAVTGAGSAVERFDLALGDRRQLLAERRRALADGDRAGLLALAVLRHPADAAPIHALVQTSGRRLEHAIWMALGWAGAVERAEVLREQLRATDVDPGRGFAQRRVVATALGRLGLRVALPWLLRALEDEVHDHEGRPGAGLGIQYPVRTNLLWALGETGDAAAVPVLLRHLGDRHGSALGGFYLPAMDALSKIPAAVPALEAAAASADDEVAAHAVASLAAAGRPVGRWEEDPRPAVRAIARESKG